MSTYARARGQSKGGRPPLDPPSQSKGGRPPLNPPKGVMSKAARHAKIITLLEQREVRSQGELANLLADDGVQVNQGTLSRDLVEIGALRVRSSGGHLVYAVPGEGGDRTPHVGEFASFEGRLARLCAEILVSAETSANLVVLRTPPGAAQYFASAVDKVGWESILGTIAGDDTILLITRAPDGGNDIARRFLIMSRTGKPVDGSTPTHPNHSEKDELR